MRATASTRTTRDDDARPDLTDEGGAFALPEPPEGYVYRWIRFMLGREFDWKNVNQRFDREGWEPVRIEEVPAAFRIQKATDERFAGCVQNGDTILAKLPVEKAEEYKARVRARTMQQTEGIRNQLMRASDSRMPIHDESSSRVITGSGRRPSMDD